MNEQVLYNKYYEKFSAFKEAVLGFLRSLFDPCPELKRLLQSRITVHVHGGIEKVLLKF